MKNLIKLGEEFAEIEFFDAQGNLATGAVGTVGYDKKSGEMVFYEIVGNSNDVRGGCKVNGKNTYHRIFIKRVWPHLPKENN